MKKLFITLLACLFAGFLYAEVRLPQLFQSGMVLQRGKPIPVWGWAAKGEQVQLTFNKKVYTAEADSLGRWRIDLPKMKAGGPYIIKVKGEQGEALEIADVLIGDVWLCSGQSNIDVPVERVYPQYPQDIDAYENPQIRLFRVQNDTDTHGVRDDIRPTAINWLPVTKQNAWNFSAVGYFLGRRMFQETKVPQGIIVNSWGGTPIEAWISADSLQRDYPGLVKRARFFQSDDYVKAQSQANALAAKQWQHILDADDPGVSGQFASPACDDTSWQEIDQTNWGWQGIGTVWLRQHVHIDKAHAGRPARLLLGTLFDADYTYLNGKEIGRTYYQYPPRRYDIAEGQLREGDNVITVRFVNKFGTAHFIKEKPYLLAFGDDRESQNPMPKDIIPLSPRWKLHHGVDMPACPGGDVSLQNIPTTLYNAVLHPLAPYGLSGVVWYQGESNTGAPVVYADYLKKLMGCWRDRWQDQQMPFVIVQLANFMAPSAQPQESNWARLRESQRLAAAADPRAELAVINDLGETVDIHPLRKKEVAERIGLAFDRLVYNKKVALSPSVVSSEVREGRLVLTLDQPVRPGECHGFEVAGADGKFQNAVATASGSSITILSPLTSHLSPLKLRYAWKDNPLEADVRSVSGLPMSSFELVINSK